MASHHETPVVRVLAALLPPLAAFALQWALWGLIEPLVWFLFYPAVFISFWIGGRRSGVIATVLSISLVWWHFLPPPHSLAKSTVQPYFSTGAFLVMGVLFGVFHGRLTAANERAQAMVTAALDCIISMDAQGLVTA